jgi:hypothetical protein
MIQWDKIGILYSKLVINEKKCKLTPTNGETLGINKRIHQTTGET